VAGWTITRGLLVASMEYQKDHNSKTLLRSTLRITLNSLKSVDYHSELDVAMAFYRDYCVYQLGYIIVFRVYTNHLCFCLGKK
jgi:hypothetical protein